VQQHHIFFPAVAFAAILSATPVNAQSTGDRSQHFNGLYIGAGGGFDAQPNHRGQRAVFDTDRNGSYDNVVLTGAGSNAFAPGFCPGRATSTGPATGCQGDQDKGEFFGRVGFDRRMGNFVVGALIEGSKTYARDYTTAFSSTPHFYTFERGVDWMAAARLRAGFTPAGGILFYGTGGGVYANMKNRFYTSNTTSTFAVNGKDSAWGYQAGGGIEAMVARHISVGMEYLYTDINDDKSFVTAAGGPFGTGTNMRPTDQSFNYHAVRGSVNFRF
jgi:outer membrane immunogenic protein